MRELLNRVPQRTAPRDFDRGSATTVGLRWEPTGAAAGQFPVLDADITLTPEGEHRTRLALAGTYRAPLGRLGAGLDKAILQPRGHRDHLCPARRDGRRSHQPCWLWSSMARLDPQPFAGGTSGLLRRSSRHA